MAAIMRNASGAAAAWSQRIPSIDRVTSARTAIEANRDGTAHDLVAAIRDAVAAFWQSVEPADDVTIVAVGRRRDS